MTQGSENFDLDKNPRGFIFLHLKSEKSVDFEHKRRVPGNPQTENLGGSCGISVLQILQTENLKRKSQSV